MDTFVSANATKSANHNFRAVHLWARNFLMKHLNPIVAITLKIALEIHMACWKGRCRKDSRIVLFLFGELIVLDKCCICTHVPAVTNNTTSIIQETAFQRSTPPPLSCTSADLFSLLPLPSFLSLSLSLCPLCFHLPCFMPLPVFIFH